MEECLYGIMGADLIWHPMFYYDSWKCHFSQTIVFLRWNFKNRPNLGGKFKENFCKHKIVFWGFCKIAIEMNVFLSFLKMWPFFTHWHSMFHYAQLHKKHHFCQFVWGDTQVHFQISLNVLYETFLIYTLSLKHK